MLIPVVTSFIILNWFGWWFYTSFLSLIFVIPKLFHLLSLDSDLEGLTDFEVLEELNWILEVIFCLLFLLSCSFSSTSTKQ